MTPIEKYYGKFNEDHRLTTRHGTVEFEVTMHHIHKLLKETEVTRILDIGAGTGRYSLALHAEGYDVTAVELVKKNLAVLESKHSGVKCFNADARNLSMLPDDTFDMTLLFGPLYHLHGQDKLTALKEASRVTKKGGYILCAYVMNDYALMMYCFDEDRMPALIEEKKVTDSFVCADLPEELYSYSTLEQIDLLNQEAGLERSYIFAPDGPSDYMRQKLNAMSEETFRLFIEYQKTASTRKDLTGASSHTVDVLKNTK